MKQMKGKEKKKKGEGKENEAKGKTCEKQKGQKTHLRIQIGEYFFLRNAAFKKKEMNK